MKSTTHEKTLPNGEKIVVTARMEWINGNAEPYFGLTTDVYTRGGRLESGGCQHDLIREHFPELAYLIKWHLCGPSGPLHYIANTTYFATSVPEFADTYRVSITDPSGHGELYFRKNTPEMVQELEECFGRVGHLQITSERERNLTPRKADLAAARRTALWPDATLEQLADIDALFERLPGLQAEFKAAMQEAGLWED